LQDTTNRGRSFPLNQGVGVMKYVQDKGCQRILIAGCITLAAIFTLKILLALPKSSKDHDFANYYCSSRIYIDYENPYIIPLQTFYEYYEFNVSFEHFELNRVTNPPLLLLLFAPLAMLPPFYAFAIWFFIEIASLVVMLSIIKQLVKDRISKIGFLIIYTLSIASGPVYNNFMVSQVQLSLAALTLAGYAFLKSGKSIASCIIITLAGLIKLYPVSLIPWFIWHNGKSHKERLKLTIICIVFTVMMFWISGFDTWIDFFQHTRDAFRIWIENRSANYSIPSFMINSIFSLFHFSPPQQISNITWFFAIFSALTIPFVVYLFLWNNRQLNESNVREKEFALLCVTMLATSLITWQSYFVFLILPFVITFLQVKETSNKTRFLGMILIWVSLNNLTNFVSNIIDKEIFLKVLINYIPLYGLIALGIFILKDIRQLRF
jgi:small neutral amino acid transporter SnatA (MarC family)